MKPSAPPPYRISTIEPVTREEIIATFRGSLVDPSSSELVLQCEDGSQILLHASSQSQKYFAEFRIQFLSAIDGALSFGLLPQVIEFCRAHGGQMKALRNGSVLPASSAMLSDVFWSETYRKAKHLAHHPKDKQMPKVGGDDV
jgi:hypothetical protein